jgi:hypothetical protein
MDENVLAALALDETKALAGVKPLHCSLFFHRCVPLIYKSYLVHSFSGNLSGSRASFADSPDTAVRRAGNKKRPQVESCDPLKTKGETRATNAAIEYHRLGWSARGSVTGVCVGEEGYQRSDIGKPERMVSTARVASVCARLGRTGEG